MRSWFLTALRTFGLPVAVLSKLIFSLSACACAVFPGKNWIHLPLSNSRGSWGHEHCDSVGMSWAVSQKASGEVLERREVCEPPQLGGLWSSPQRAWVRWERKECNCSLIRNPDSLLQNVLFPFLPQKWPLRHLKTNDPAKKLHSSEEPVTTGQVFCLIHLCNLQPLA